MDGPIIKSFVVPESHPDVGTAALGFARGFREYALENDPDYLAGAPDFPFHYAPVLVMSAAQHLHSRLVEAEAAPQQTMKVAGSLEVVRGCFARLIEMVGLKIGAFGFIMFDLDEAEPELGRPVAIPFWSRGGADDSRSDPESRERDKAARRDLDNLERHGEVLKSLAARAKPAAPTPAHPDDERDRFLYEQGLSNIRKWGDIVRQSNATPGWGKLNSGTAARSAANRYVARQRGIGNPLAPLPAKRRGGNGGRKPGPQSN